MMSHVQITPIYFSYHSLFRRSGQDNPTRSHIWREPGHTASCHTGTDPPYMAATLGTRHNTHSHKIGLLTLFGIFSEDKRNFRRDWKR